MHRLSRQSSAAHNERDRLLDVFPQLLLVKFALFLD